MATETSEIYYEPLAEGYKLLKIPTKIFHEQKQYINGMAFYRHNEPVYYHQNGQNMVMEGTLGYTILKPATMGMQKELIKYLKNHIV